MHRESYNNSGSDCYSAVTPTVIVAHVLIAKYLQSMHDSHVSHLHFLLLSLSPALISIIK